MNVSADQDFRFPPPPVAAPEPRKSPLRVGIHFSAALLFYGTVYGLIGVVLLFSKGFTDAFTHAPLTESC